MESTNKEHIVAHRIIEGALGDVNQDKNIIAERVRMKLLEQSMILEDAQLQLRVQITIAEAVLDHRRTRIMAGPSLAQRILDKLRKRQLLK